MLLCSVVLNNVILPQTSDTHFLSLGRREVAVCFSPMSMDFALCGDDKSSFPVIPGVVFGSKSNKFSFDSCDHVKSVLSM